MKTILYISVFLVGLYMTSQEHHTQSKRSTPDYLSSKELARVNLFKKVSASVVTIFTKLEVVSEKGIGQGAGLGSGVLISNECHILTAAHVVAGRSDIKVKTTDGKIRTAKVLFNDRSADIALLQLEIPDKSLTHVTLGNSDNLAVGQSIYAVGSPYGMENSFSSGIISAFRGFDRIYDGTVKVEFIQTDAAINSGNSGGPLFNSKGEVVGIASSILTVSGGFQGIGMAVTSNTAKSLLSFEDRPWIGVDGVLLQKEDFGLLFNLDIEGGILVQSVVKGSPADKAGIRGGSIKTRINGAEVLLGGDIITNVGGHSTCHIGCMEEVKEELANEKSVEVTYLRSGKANTVLLDLSETRRNFLTQNKEVKH